MKKTKIMYAEGFYLLKGESSANSSFVEDKEEAHKFLEECTKRLSGFAKIHDFLITQDGWMLVISLLDEKTIKSTYKARWMRSCKVKKECFLDIVWRIVSEQVRQIIFTFVLFSNKKNKREGSKVKRSYERFWFKNVEEAKDQLKKMRKQLIRMEQGRKTYRSKKRHFRISNSEAKGAVFLCSLRLTNATAAELFGASCIDLLSDKFDVLRYFIKTTLTLHSSQNSTNQHPNTE